MTEPPLLPWTKLAHDATGTTWDVCEDFGAPFVVLRGAVLAAAVVPRHSYTRPVRYLWRVERGFSTIDRGEEDSLDAAMTAAVAAMRAGEKEG